jgi:hypothetical protein
MIITKKRMLHLANEVSHGLDKLEKKPGVKSVVGVNGYSDEAVSSIRKICTDAVEFYNNKQVQDNDKKGIYTSLRKKRKELRRHVAALVLALRDVYEDDPAALKTYGVAQKLPENPDPLKEYARALYEKVLEDIDDEKLLPFGIDKENIQVGVTLIGEIEDLVKKYRDLKSNKEFSTSERNRIFRLLKKVWKAFQRKCRDLFYDAPHELEGIIPVPYDGFKRRPVKTEPGEDTPENSDSSDTFSGVADVVESTESGDLIPVEGGSKRELEEVLTI